MEKRITKVFSSGLHTVLLPIFTVIIIAIMLSCKTSHSVREIKASRNPELGYVSKKTQVKVPHTKEDAMTKDLFMTSQRPNIELPYVEGADKGSGTAMISEQVTYTNAEVITKSNSPEEGKVTNLNEVQHLNEVVVTAKSRFTPEQNGRVNIDFVVKVPKNLISPNWRLTLSPVLLHNDSLVPLKDVVIKGQTFADKQKESYADYDKFLKSIVDKSKYDSVFVDYTGVRKDINTQQGFYYGQYHKEWSRQTDFETWKSDKDEVEALTEAKGVGYTKKIYHENARKVREKAMKDFAKGKDTTGYFAKYMKRVIKPEDLEKGKQKIEQKNEYRVDFYKEFSQRARQQVLRDWSNGKDTIGAYNRYMKSFDKNMKKMVLDGEDMSKIPDRFRDIYREGRTMDQIANQVFSEKDSIDIVQHRYKYEDIALNEMKQDMSESKRKEIIAFPYETNTRLDSIVENSTDFVYYYKQDYPVSPGMRRLRLTMNSKVDAIDRSSYTNQPADTLSYFISSLSQLVDTSLITKRTTVHRDMYNTMVIYPKFLAGKWSFNNNYKDNKAETDKVINTYKTFTGEGNLVMDSVVLRVSTSLDGEYEKNIELSMKRVEALQAFFAKALNVSSDVFKVRHSGEDWNTMARLMVKREDMPNKSQILEMLTQAVNPDQTETEIKKTFPTDYKIIRDSIYPMLNKADVIFNMTRPGMAEEITVNTEVRPEYAKALQHLQDREYWKALDILSDYPDYNTALCLVSMGYNMKAFELLQSLEQTGNTEYLLAILAIRSGDDNKATEHLLKACELDPSKAYRAPLDPEVAAFVRKYDLQDRLLHDATSSDKSMVEEDLKQE
ncbi:type IV pilus biogenesis/stability protein PilW [Dysgonomonas sp. BGC7]|uniref:tetratricopeptide repeat protein n=1 Tax=Dysgonomonas sp. BGC7 TaxID=1658008 RepID=UPI00068298F2|nr:hypothetical protein [Dysgonomonas sp. BGC7]MBD8388274.1 hypothetical protein [Dysgonomonas sp. BGC7]